MCHHPRASWLVRFDWLCDICVAMYFNICNRHINALFVPNNDDAVNTNKSTTNFSSPVNLLICTRYYTITPLGLHALVGRLINFSTTCHDFSLNLVTDRLVTWLLQSGMDYLLISDFHPLSTPLNQTPSENSPFQISDQHPYRAAT